MTMRATTFPALLIATPLLLAAIISADAHKSDSEAKLNAARDRMESGLAEKFAKAGLKYPPEKIFIRVFKMERELEFWAKNSGQDQFILVQKYKACALSGNLGPKRKQGDHQVPEGFYVISEFNPQSKFHLSLRVNYPNRSDAVLSDKRKPGADIFIHGSCVSDGCVAIKDGPIEELYLSGLDAKSRGQKSIPVHIFPCRMNNASCERALGFFAINNEGLKKFWNSLKPGYEYFEKNKAVPRAKVGKDGYYIFN